MPTYEITDEDRCTTTVEADWFQVNETPGVAVFYVGGHEVAAFRDYKSVTSDETPDEEIGTEGDQPFNVINVSVSGSNPSETAKELLYHIRCADRKYGTTS